MFNNKEISEGYHGKWRDMVDNDNPGNFDDNTSNQEEEERHSKGQKNTFNAHYFLNLFKLHQKYLSFSFPYAAVVVER